MNFPQLWPYLVLFVLALIAYRLYKIQEALTGGVEKRRKQREQSETNLVERQTQVPQSPLVNLILVATVISVILLGLALVILWPHSG